MQQGQADMMEVARANECNRGISILSAAEQTCHSSLEAAKSAEAARHADPGRPVLGVYYLRFKEIAKALLQRDAAVEIENADMHMAAFLAGKRNILTSGGT